MISVVNFFVKRIQKCLFFAHRILELSALVPSKLAYLEETFPYLLMALWNALPACVGFIPSLQVVVGS